jgi:DsbC/DsbD-like thiol-disulfide interchange protein
MRLLALAIAVSAIAAPVAAAETSWQEVAPGVSIRLISTGTLDADGFGRMALEIDMPPDTKTYWRVPGETGLPLELDFTASWGLGEHRVLWPYPTRESKNGFVDYVYYGHTVLPLEIEVLDPAGQVSLTATLGICSDICVPAEASFTLPLVDKRADRASTLRIKQALAEVPIVWQEGLEPIGQVELLSEDALTVEITDDTVDPQSVIATVDQGELMFGPSKTKATILASGTWR